MRFVYTCNVERLSVISNTSYIIGHWINDNGDILWQEAYIPLQRYREPVKKDNE